MEIHYVFKLKRLGGFKQFVWELSAEIFACGEFRNVKWHFDVIHTAI